MIKNHPISIKLSLEELDVLGKALEKINSESKIKISKTNVIRVLIKRGCYEIISGNAKSSELFFNTL